MYIVLVLILVVSIAAIVMAFISLTRQDKRCTPSVCTSSGCEKLREEQIHNSVPSGIAGVNYDPKMCKSSMSHCTGSGADCDITKSIGTQSFFGYRITIKGTDPSVSGKECGFMYDGGGLCDASKVSTNNWNDAGRPVWIYYPDTVLAPGASGSIPYVMYFSFIPWNANSLDPADRNGLYSPDRDNTCTFGDQCALAPMSPLWIQLQLQTFLAAGYAVVMTTMIGDDSYMYQECNKNLATSSYNLCWNGGDNPDARYLNALFGLIEGDTLFENGYDLIPADPVLGSLPSGADSFPKLDISLNHDSCGLIGYSVGAQMVSRAINDFGNNSTYLPNSPKVDVACMISGGSLHCYQYCNADSTTVRGPGKSLCNSQPSNFGPCWDKDGLGCCPTDLTEPRYDDSPGQYMNHPPVILVQTDFDYFADPRASENYYRTLSKKAAGSVDTEIVHGLCGDHNLFPAAVVPVLQFFVKHMVSTRYTTLTRPT